MRKRKTNETFENEVYTLVGSEYTFLEPYIDHKTKIKVRHNKCGYTYSIRPNDFLSKGTRCPKCAKKIYNKTTDYFKQEVFELVGDEYEVLGEYKNNKTKILIRHNLCNSTYEVVPHSFLQGRRCSYCYGKKLLTQSEFENIINSLTKDEYSVLGKYNGANKKVLLKHNTCGCEWETLPLNFIHNSARCPDCFGKTRKTTAQFKEEVYSLVKDEYRIIGEYKDARSYIKIMHRLCNNGWDILPDSFLRGTRCPVCNESKGEQKIRRWLEKNDKDFKDQYSFDDLLGIGGKLLRFDFGVLNDEGNLDYLVEYDGIGHYNQSVFGTKSYYTTLRHDKLKDKYCKDKNIKLIRIPYWEYEKIEEILESGKRCTSR